MPKETNPELLAKMAAEARMGRLSRRDFMNFALAAGIGTTMASGFWTSKVAQAAPKKGGTFRWGIHDGNTSDTHDPGTYVTRQMIFLAHQYRSYLTMINPDNSLGPDLATGWGKRPRMRSNGRSRSTRTPTSTVAKRLPRPTSWHRSTTTAATIRRQRPRLC